MEMGKTVIHYIADDLGLPRDHQPGDTVTDDLPSWLDRADVLLELEVQDRLTAERLLDEIDKHEVA